MDLNLPLPLLLSRVEEESIRRALKTTGNNVRRAAAHLGIPRQTLQYKLRRLGPEPEPVSGCTGEKHFCFRKKFFLFPLWMPIFRHLFF